MPHPSFSAKLPPAKPKNADRRAREYLMPTEVERLIGAARQVGRHGHRDATLILLMYRHGLRVAEVSSLRWTHIDLPTALLHVRRLKHGVSSVCICLHDTGHMWEASSPQPVLAGLMRL
jgi:integrase